MKEQLIGVIRVNADGSKNTMTWHETMEKADAEASRLSQADTTGTMRFHIVTSTGYYGKAVPPPEWHPVETGKGKEK